MTVPVSWIPKKKKKTWKWNPLSKDHKMLFPLRDDDKDGVLNAFDCEPLNRKKQGKLHDISRQLREDRERELKKLKGKEWEKNKMKKAATEAERFAEELKDQEFPADKDRFLGVTRNYGLKSREVKRK